MKIAVIGVGYIGLPTAAILATSGFNVTGYDIDRKKILRLRKFKFDVKEPGLKSIIDAGVKSGMLKFDYKLPKSDVYILCLPTPKKNSKPDLSYLFDAVKEVYKLLEKNNLIIVESTVPPGTTMKIKSILDKKGFKYYLAHSPERVLPGKILKELVENHRIIGGVDLESAIIAKSIYEKFVDAEIVITDATTAEIVKLMENTYRDVNIALANEFLRICDKYGVDVYKAIKFANMHPRVNILNPGIGVGGHCIPVDPLFLICNYDSKIIKITRKLNDSQPNYVSKIILDFFSDEKKLKIWGITYKPDVDDTRESPALKICEILEKNGKKVEIYDPVIGMGTPDVLDGVVVLVGHSYFKDIDPTKLKAKNKKIFDAVNVI
ncbi:MAG: nucleotide sugar dehydrogenase, partial [bacterium]|nr:nucleotide sugar dehydrogenase [bacterium]